MPSCLFLKAQFMNNQRMLLLLIHPDCLLTPSHSLSFSNISHRFSIRRVANGSAPPTYNWYICYSLPNQVFFVLCVPQLVIRLMHQNNPRWTLRRCVLFVISNKDGIFQSCRNMMDFWIFPLCAPFVKSGDACCFRSCVHTYILVSHGILIISRLVWLSSVRHPTLFRSV